MVHPAARRAWLGKAFLVLAVLVAALLTASNARAQASLDLRWDAPAGCPDRGSIEAGVQRLVTTAPAETLVVRASVRPEGERWAVDLTMQGAASGKRTLRASSCASVARAAALIIALALDPTAASHASDELGPNDPPPAPIAPPPPLPPPTPPAKSASTAVIPATASSSVRLLAFVGGGVDRAVLPGFVPLVTAGGGIRWRALRLDLSADIAPGKSVSLDARPGVASDLSFIALSLRACAGRAFGWVGVDACAAARGTRISGEGTGVTESFHRTAEIVSLEPGVLLRFPARTRFGVELGASAVVPITRPDFVIETTDQGPANEPLFRVSTVGARATLAVGILF